MAYRRSRSFKPRFGSRFSRSRLRTVRPTQRWSRGQFALSPTLEVDTFNQDVSVTIPIAQIYDHVFGGTNSAARFTGNQIVRSLEVGGVVFDAQCYLLPQTSVADMTENVQAYAQILLGSDRIDSDGVPVALASNFFTNTIPITLTTAAEIQDNDATFPTRIHWRHGAALGASIQEFPDDQSGPSNAMAVRAQWSASLRLRLRLGDTDGLNFYCQLSTTSLWPVISTRTLQVQFFIVGSIYYRVRT